MSEGISYEPLTKTEKERLAQRKRDARYRAKHPEREKARHAVYFAANRKKELARLAAWTEAHPEQRKASQAALWKANPGKGAAYQAAYRARNREKVKALRAAWDKANRAKLRAKEAADRAVHPEKYRAKARAQYAKNPERFAAQVNRRRALKRGASASRLTAQEWIAIKQHYKFRCIYCGKKNQRLTQEHLTPLSQSGAHDYTNVVPACRMCNSTRRDGPVPKPVQPLLLLEI